jgi:hypothetical protein
VEKLVSLRQFPHFPSQFPLLVVVKHRKELLEMAFDFVNRHNLIRSQIVVIVPPLPQDPAQPIDIRLGQPNKPGFFAPNPSFREHFRHTSPSFE